MAYVRKTDPVEKAKREQRVVELYKQGVPMDDIAVECHISKFSIRDIAKKHGVYIPKRHKILNGPNPEEGLKNFYKEQEERKKEKGKNDTSSRTLQKMQEAIRPTDIARIRKSIKVGSKLYIGTEKAIDIHGTNGEDNHAPLIRVATVISTNDPVFCIVKIDKTGFTESIRWIDIEIARREGCKYV